MPKRPNIVLIMSDNQPASLLGAYGNREIHTPHLDRMAGEGVRFDNAYCVNAMCSPCRASVLTGLIPSQHGIHTWLDDRIMDRWPALWNAIGEFDALPAILKRHGYRTALIGKYHLGVPDEPQNGFERWVTFPLGHTISFWNNTFIENGGRTYEYAGHSVDGFTEQAVAYLREQTPDRPFFLYLPYNAPYGHYPSIKGPARNRFASRYADTPMNSVPREGLSPPAIRRSFLRQHESGKGMDYTSHLQIPNNLEALRNYYSQMSMVDDGVGRVLDTLRERGLEEDTLVIFTADQGFSLGHHGYWGHGQATWPATCHGISYSIPLLMRQPGRIAAGTSSARLVSQVDLFATLLDVAGIERPASPFPSPARSLTPLLEDQGAAWPDEVFMEQEEVRAIRTSEWLFMKRFKGCPNHPFEDELYDLVADPGERANLIADPARAGVVAELSARLDAYFERYGNRKYDLWRGGTVKSNSDKPAFWKDAWGRSGSRCLRDGTASIQLQPFIPQSAFRIPHSNHPDASAFERSKSGVSRSSIPAFEVDSFPSTSRTKAGHQSTCGVVLARSSIVCVGRCAISRPRSISFAVPPTSGFSQRRPICACSTSSAQS
ncbi:MAG: sulfatase-like hydrolase/transferase [Planctomycetota bacterium]|nr:sulfatase-like hydrolase/transferase [Planctomycetota bacterium]